MKRLLALSLAFAVLPAVASAAIVVEKPEIRPTLGNQKTSAAYMVLRNTGKEADRLIDAACACAASVMAHRSVTKNGVASMEMEHMVAIPAGGSVAFEPGGRHLMLTGVKTPIKAGDKASIVLTFEKAGRITTAFTASDTAGMAAMGGTNHQHAH